MNILNLRVLSVGEGDLTIKFDDKNEAEKKRAADLIKDLLRKGYAIMVQSGTNDKGPIYQRVSDFDPATNEYIVFGDPAVDIERPYQSQEIDDRPKTAKGKPGSRVPSKAPAIAVARTAGGYDPVVPRKIRRGTSLREVDNKL